MNPSVRTTARMTWAALRALLVLTVVTGLVYPLVATGIAQAAFSGQANGSEVRSGGKVVGSSRYGQTFDLPKKDPDDPEEAPRPDPRWFQPRPSAAGVNDDLGILVSGASNLAPTSPELKALVEERRARVAEFNGVRESEVPPDAVTASASGIDPHISPAYAELQADRVAGARGLAPERVRKLVEEHTRGRIAGFLGNERVNVLELNAALDRLVRLGGGG